MKTKETVLQYLLLQNGEYVSGQTIASKLNISRNSVWKAIKSLEGEGYNIQATSKKGYLLKIDNDILSKKGIEQYLINKEFFDVEVHEIVESTNTLCKEASSNMIIPGKVIASACQTKGRGRYTRNFYSPEQTGVYFSIVLTPKVSHEQLLYFTSIAAISVCAAIKKSLNKDVAIKWVNDIFLENKKVCGILTEASYSVENFSLEYIVIGIGINIYKPSNGFPDELKEIAGYLLDEEVVDIRNKLIAETLENIYSYIINFDINYIHDEYKKKSMVIGRTISFRENDQLIKAAVKDINIKNELIVELSDGQERILNSGEISILLN